MVGPSIEQDTVIAEPSSRDGTDAKVKCWAGKLYSSAAFNILLSSLCRTQAR